VHDIEYHKSLTGQRFCGVAWMQLLAIVDPIHAVTIRPARTCRT